MSTDPSSSDPPELWFWKSGAMLYAPDDAAMLLRDALWRLGPMKYNRRVALLRKRAALLYEETWHSEPSGSDFYRIWRLKLLIFRLTGRTDFLADFLPKPFDLPSHGKRSEQAPD
jgi:hypothetical protein